MLRVSLAMYVQYQAFRTQTREVILDEGGPTMPSLDWSQCPAVESVPGRVSGAWTFRNSRTPVKLVFENLDDGMTIDEIIEQYPVSREEIKAVLEFAAQSLDKEPSY
jgi:uncharacterized protein (DUF433 family)